MSFKTPSNLSCSLTAEWLMWAHRTFRVKAEGAVTTARQNSKETSTYNGHLRYEHPPDGVGHAARNISVQRAEPRANAAPAARPAAPPAACPGLGPPRRPPRPSRCAPSPQPASGRATRAAAHARSVFSMMNLTFSSVSSVMRTVGWLAYGMAAPDGALLGRRRTPSRRPRAPPAGSEDPTHPARRGRSRTEACGGESAGLYWCCGERTLHPRSGAASERGAPSSAALVQPRQVGDLWAQKMGHCQTQAVGGAQQGVGNPQWAPQWCRIPIRRGSYCSWSRWLHGTAQTLCLCWEMLPCSNRNCRWR